MSAATRWRKHTAESIKKQKTAVLSVNSCRWSRQIMKESRPFSWRLKQKKAQTSTQRALLLSIIIKTDHLFSFFHPATSHWRICICFSNHCRIRVNLMAQLNLVQTRKRARMSTWTLKRPTTSSIATKHQIITSRAKTYRQPSRSDMLANSNKITRMKSKNQSFVVEISARIGHRECGVENWMLKLRYILPFQKRSGMKHTKTYTHTTTHIYTHLREHYLVYPF